MVLKDFIINYGTNVMCVVVSPIYMKPTLKFIRFLKKQSVVHNKIYFINFINIVNF